MQNSIGIVCSVTSDCCVTVTSEKTYLSQWLQFISYMTNQSKFIY